MFPCPSTSITSPPGQEPPTSSPTSWAVFTPTASPQLSCRSCFQGSTRPKAERQRYVTRAVVPPSHRRIHSAAGLLPRHVRVSGDAMLPCGIGACGGGDGEWTGSDETGVGVERRGLGGPTPGDCVFRATEEGERELASQSKASRGRCRENWSLMDFPASCCWRLFVGREREALWRGSRRRSWLRESFGRLWTGLARKTDWGGRSAGCRTRLWEARHPMPQAMACMEVSHLALLSLRWFCVIG